MKRFTITVPDTVFADLGEWAQQQGRPPATLAAYLVELSIQRARDSGEFTRPKEQQAKAS